MIKSARALAVMLTGAFLTTGSACGTSESDQGTVDRTTSDRGSAAALFDYDRTEPLDLRVADTRVQGGTLIEEISFAVPELRLEALLLRPEGPGPHPGIVIAPEGVSYRETFLDEGLQLARLGAIVLLVDGPWAAAQLFDWPRCSEDDRFEVMRSVVELRRALDVLVDRPDVDDERLALVGFSYSAWTTGILAGVDERPKAFVLESGEATMTRFLGERCGASAAYLSRMRPFDPVRYVGRAEPAAVLLQNAESDEFWPRGEMARLQEATSDPKTVRWYDARHALNATARRARIEWLSGQLGLGDGDRR